MGSDPAVFPQRVRNVVVINVSGGHRQRSLARCCTTNCSQIVTEPLVYLNGRMLPASEAHLKIYDAGIVLGATITEQVRTFGKRLYKLDEHLDRLWYSLRSSRIDIGLTRGEVTAISQELVAHHG